MWVINIVKWFAWENVTNTAWGLTGNAGTNPTTNFIGTTDGMGGFNDTIAEMNTAGSNWVVTVGDSINY